MDARTIVLTALLLLVIIGMLALAVRFRRVQRQADEASVILDERINDVYTCGISEPADSFRPSHSSEPSPLLGSDGRPAAASLPEPQPVQPESLEPHLHHEPTATAEPDEVGAYRLRAPIEIWFGESAVGVKSGTPTYDSFQKYAAVLLGDLKAIERATR